MNLFCKKETTHYILSPIPTLKRQEVNCCASRTKMRKNNSGKTEMMMIDNMTVRHLMFMLMQCTAWSKRSAVEDKDDRCGNRQMDDRMLKCKLHG